MTDDVPTSDGTRHTEEAVNIPQVTDPRTSSLEDIAQVLSAKTPDIADDPHPEKAEKADSDGAGPAEGSAAEAASADADTHDADTETGTESVAESAAGDGPESSAEGKAESDAEADQDDAPVEEESEDSQTEAEAPREGDAVVEPGDSTDELSEGESVTDEDARPESEAAESDPDAEPESEAVEEAAEPDVEPEEAETAEAEVAESDETENDGASTEDSEVTEPDAAAAEVEADESQVGEGEPAAESEESSSADEAEPVEEAAESAETEAVEAEVAESDETENDGAPAEDSETTESDAEVVETEEAEEAEAGESESDEPDEGASESVDDPEDGEPVEPDTSESSEKESEASEEEPQAVQAAADEASQDGSAVETEEEEAGAESKDAVAAPVGEALAAMSAPTPAETPQFDEIPAPAGDKPAAGAADEAARTTGASDSSGSSDGAAPEAAADSTSAASAVSATSAKVKAALVKAKAALMELLHGRGPGRGMMACIIGLGLLVLIWGGAAVATTQHIFAGSTVSGVDVGDMSPAEARQAVDDHVGAALTHPVILTVNDSTDTLVPADSGVSVDADASVDRLVGPTLNPVTLIKRLSGSDVDAVTTVDTEALTAALNERLDTLATGTADAVVTLDGTTPVVTPGATGTGLDVDASVKSLSADWPLGQEAIALASGTAKPAITDEDAQTFVDSVLTPLLADDLTITAVGTSAEKNATGKQLVLSPEQIASLTTISTADGELSAVLDSQRLHDDLIAAMGPIETQAVNAGWTIDGSATGAAGAKPQYVAPSSGEGIDMAALTQQLIDTGTTKSASADRTVAIPMTTTEPDTTTPEADWGITEVTGEFATPFNSEPGRDQNLIRGAEQMNGQVVMSGQTFSVEEALGPVDYEHGFTDAGVISNGQHVDALGGGLSQIGTTMFNVGFEAGMDDVEHHPHSYYFDRYPAGREATLWTGQKDVKFTNSTPYAALIQAWVADGQVHTRIWSTHYYDVSITSSERYNYRPVQTLTRPAGSGCQSYYGGNPGFDITVTRTRTAPDKTVPDDVLTTTYDADNNIECTGSAKPSQSLQPGSSTTDQGRSSWEAAPQPIGEADTPAAGGVAAQPQPAQPQDATGAEENLPNAPEGSSDGGSPAGTP